MASQLLGIKTRFTNDLGQPLIGGQVYTYFAGTSTNQDSYSDAALTVPNTNPVILDDTGSADIFLKGAYRIRVFDKSGRFIEEQDNVTQAASQGDATELSNKVSAVESDLVTANTELSKVKLDTGITATAKFGGVERTQAEKNSDYTTLMDFGGKCDGVTDDSDALQSYLDTDINVINIPDTCLIKKGVISNTPNRVIRTTGYGIICGTAAKNFEALTINGDNTQVHVDIDGRNSAYFGVVVNGDNCRVHKSTIQNIYNPFGAAIAIKVDGDVSAEITYNRLINIDALTNNILSDSAGACRGVWITSDTARTGNVIVSNNYIKNVLGEEGDAIHVIAFDNTYPFLSANTLVADNTIINCNRRAIKIQANDCQVLNNIHINNLPLSELLNAAWVIDVMYCSSVIVKGNTIDARVAFSGIGIKGDRTLYSASKYITVSNNTVVVGLLGENTVGRPPTVNRQLAIYSKSSDNCFIANNDILGSVSAIVIDNNLRTIAKDNTIGGDVVTADTDIATILITESCNGCVVSGNTLNGGDRRGFLVVDGKNSVIINNIIASGTTPLLTFNNNPEGSYIDNNINLGSGSGLSFTGSNDKNVKIGRIVTTQGNSLYPSTYFSRSKPETYHDKVWFSRGDIVYNALAYGTDFDTVRGWRCTASGKGTVATWETI